MKSLVDDAADWWDCATLDERERILKGLPDVWFDDLKLWQQRAIVFKFQNMSKREN